MSSINLTQKKENSMKALQETFGIAKGKLIKPTQLIMDEIRMELYDQF